jgi:hypothetical protein
MEGHSGNSDALAGATKALADDLGPFAEFAQKGFLCSESLAPKINFLVLMRKLTPERLVSRCAFPPIGRNVTHWVRHVPKAQRLDVAWGHLQIPAKQNSCDNRYLDREFGGQPYRRY